MQCGPFNICFADSRCEALTAATSSPRLWHLVTSSSLAMLYWLTQSTLLLFFLLFQPAQVQRFGVG
jgi:hypothetical protein